MDKKRRSKCITLRTQKSNGAFYLFIYKPLKIKFYINFLFAFNITTYNTEKISEKLFQTFDKDEKG